MTAISGISSLSPDQIMAWMEQHNSKEAEEIQNAMSESDKEQQVKQDISQFESQVTNFQNQNGDNGGYQSIADCAQTFIKAHQDDPAYADAVKVAKELTDTSPNSLNLANAQADYNKDNSGFVKSGEQGEVSSGISTATQELKDIGAHIDSDDQKEMITIQSAVSTMQNNTGLASNLIATLEKTIGSVVANIHA